MISVAVTKIVYVTIYFLILAICKFSYTCDFVKLTGPPGSESLF